jgi:hypothetical protein
MLTLIGSAGFRRQTFAKSCGENDALEPSARQRSEAGARSRSLAGTESLDGFTRSQLRSETS